MLNKSRTLLVFEIIAVLTGVAYTVLYIKGYRFCFYFAFSSAAIYTYLCYQKKIFAETALQLFYVLFAIYGWLNWGADYHEKTYPFTYHLPFIFASIAGVFFAGQWLKKNTKTKMPYLDAYTSIFSLTATWFMVNFAHENWLYWMAIDSVSIYLYYKRGLKLSTILYAFYFYLAIAGYFRFDLFF